jgi:tryptophan synthase alpha chain
MRSAASRIAPAFADRSSRTGLIPFLTAGYPSLEATAEIAHALAKRGALALEIGIPFSDPIADGPEIQRASERALKLGVNRERTFELVRELRRGTDVPIVLMTYANPVLRGGADAFALAAKDAGVDGVILSDVPPDESPELWAAFDRAALDTVMLVAPTTERSRLPMLLGRSRGFVYCLARTGVTGRAGGESGSVPGRIGELREITKLPIAVGFGISNAAGARALNGIADAVIVGAAFMRAVHEDPAHGAKERVVALADEMLAALA